MRNTVLDGTQASVSGGAAYLETSTGDVTNVVAIWNDALDGAAVTLSGSAGTADPGPGDRRAAACNHGGPDRSTAGGSGA